MDIMIVDDEPKIRNGLSKLIDGRGSWHVTGCYADAMDALKGMALNSPDLVITDIKMPEINGLDMIDRMREANQDTYIIILSGYSDFGFAQRAIELGVVRYLTKPTRRQELFDAIETVERRLAGRGAGQAQDCQSGQPQEHKPGQAERPPVPNLMVQKAIDYITLNYSEKISLKEIAQELYLSPNYLSELFKRYTNQNISEYIMQLRLEKATKYLLRPEYKVGDVAGLVGFSDSRYFSSMFKRQYGMTPNEYRNKNVK